MCLNQESIIADFSQLLANDLFFSEQRTGYGKNIPYSIIFVQNWFFFLLQNIGGI